MLVVTVFALSAQDCFAFWVWSSKTGKWVNPTYRTFDTPQEQLDWAIKHFENKDYGKAISEFKKLIKKFPKSRLAPEAKFYIGLCEEKLGKYYRAFKTYQTVLEAYPLNQRLDEIVEKQYLIGEIYFKKRDYDLAKEIFDKVLINAPFGKVSDVAQYKTGLCQFKLREFTSARDSFDKIAENYSYSNYLDDASFKSALCSYKISSITDDYDIELLDRAIADAEYFLKRFQTSEFTLKAQSLLNKLHHKKAEHLFTTAQFYEKQKKTYAAIKYYEEVNYFFDNTVWAEKARDKLKILGSK